MVEQPKLWWEAGEVWKALIYALCDLLSNLGYVWVQEGKVVQEGSWRSCFVVIFNKYRTEGDLGAERRIHSGIDHTSKYIFRENVTP